MSREPPDGIVSRRRDLELEYATELCVLGLVTKD